MKGTRRMPGPGTRLAVAGLVALGTTATGAMGMIGARPAQGATIVAFTRVAKGGVNPTPHLVAVDGRSGRVFVVTSAYQAARDDFAYGVSVLDAAGGRFLRHSALSAQIPTALAVDEQTNRVFVANSSSGETARRGSVSVLDATSGRVLRTLPVDLAPQGITIDTPANRAFVWNGPPDFGVNSASAQGAGRVDVLDATSGRVLRTLAIRGYPLAAAVDGPAGRLFLATSTYHAASRSWTYGLSMRDAASGHLLHTISFSTISFPSDAGPFSLMAVDARMGHVFVAYSRFAALCRGCTNYGTGVSMLDARTGSILHTTTVRPTRVASVSLSPAAITLDERAGHVYVASSDDTAPDGRLSILDAASGKLLRAVVTVGAYPTMVAVVPSAGRLLDDAFNDGQVNGKGGLRILDAASGRLLRTVTLPTGLPSALAVDGDLAFVTAVDNFVSVLDVRSGRVVRNLDGVTGQSWQ